MKSPRCVSLILAGYNEQDNIEQSMRLSYQALDEAFENFEIILIDDASKDCNIKMSEYFPIILI